MVRPRTFEYLVLLAILGALIALGLWAVVSLFGMPAILAVCYALLLNWING